MIETINSLERLRDVLNKWSVWDLTPDGALTMQSIWGDMFDFQLDWSKDPIIFVDACRAYEEDKDMEWRAI